MKHTVHELGKLTGISVRTLHYYDEIGLLSPMREPGNGYRRYGDRDILRLQQILFFRELGFSLADIKKIMDSKQFDMRRALQDHYKLIEIKKNRLEELLSTIRTTLKTMADNKQADAQSAFKGFPQDHIDKYKDEVKARWGNTDAYKQSMQRTKNWTTADYLAVKAENEAVSTELAKCMDKPVTNATVQKLVALHFAQIQKFYDCPIPMYRALGKMYVVDKRFTATYDDVKPGLAKYLCEAIEYFCEKNER